MEPGRAARWPFLLPMTLNSRRDWSQRRCLRQARPGRCDCAPAAVLAPRVGVPPEVEARQEPTSAGKSRWMGSALERGGSGMLAMDRWQKGRRIVEELVDRMPWDVGPYPTGMNRCTALAEPCAWQRSGPLHQTWGWAFGLEVCRRVKRSEPQSHAVRTERVAYCCPRRIAEHVLAHAHAPASLSQRPSAAHWRQTARSACRWLVVCERESRRRGEVDWVLQIDVLV
jgi:hypothetical protein